MNVSLVHEEGNNLYSGLVVGTCGKRRDETASFAAEGEDSLYWAHFDIRVMREVCGILAQRQVTLAVLYPDQEVS